MAVKTRKDYFGLDLCIDTQHIVAASRMVSQTTGFVVQPNKAVVGANAFAHASGIHQDGVLKARDTYEIMRAEDVGWSTNKIVLGKLSGRNAFKTRLQELGITLASEEQLNAAFSASSVATGMPSSWSFERKALRPESLPSVSRFAFQPTSSARMIS